MDIQWSLVVFTLLAGAGAALAACNCLLALLGEPSRRRSAVSLAGFGLIAVGGLASVLHLGQPANIMAAAQNIGSLSGVSVEMICLALAALAALAYGLVSRSEAPSAAEKAVGAVAIVCSLALCVATGSGYMIEARAAWCTPLLPLAYLGSDLAMGSALLVALGFPSSAETIPPKAKTTLFAVAVAGAALTLPYALLSGILATQAAAWTVAWVAFAIAGAACAFLGWKQPDKTMAFFIAACVCFVIAALALRCGMWIGGVGVMETFGAATSVYVFS